MKRILAMLVVLALLMAGAYVSLELNGKPGQEAVAFDIESGMSTVAITKNLHDSGVIANEFLFKVYLKLSGKGGSIKAGTHPLQKRMNYKALVKELTSNPVEEYVTVTIPEGFEFRMIADRLAELGLVEKDAFYEEAQKGRFENSFVSDLPKRELRLEGYLFPDTYQFTTKMDEHDILQVMLNRFEEIYNETYGARARELGMTMDEVITLASVIEREAANPGEAPLVSSVFHNRLSGDFNYLQSCATVQYILKERKPVLSTEDTKIDSPYNTYLYPGLPAGPIASPGESSIKAALYPEDTDYYYFVVGEDATSQFSKTYDEHLSKY